ncbi:MAG: hypothetical protein IPM92_03660 [Saprospiraceae bacterium]|nr:hypothetical protein [Saprospiraceae bacterium]
MTPSRGLFIMDFDRNTGVFSNFRQLLTGSETTDHTVGVAFSPDSRFVYLVYRWDLYQADTRSPDISSSLVHIDHWDGYVEDGIWAAGFDAAMSGPIVRSTFAPVQAIASCMSSINLIKKEKTVSLNNTDCFCRLAIMQAFLILLIIVLGTKPFAIRHWS